MRMNDGFLSQEEIDALLNGGGSTPESQPEPETSESVSVGITDVYKRQNLVG